MVLMAEGMIASNVVVPVRRPCLRSTHTPEKRDEVGLHSETVLATTGRCGSRRDGDAGVVVVARVWWWGVGWHGVEVGTWRGDCSPQDTPGCGDGGPRRRRDALTPGRWTGRKLPPGL